MRGPKVNIVCVVFVLFLDNPGIVEDVTKIERSILN